jgi:hypothetical protein
LKLNKQPTDSLQTNSSEHGQGGSIPPLSTLSKKCLGLNECILIQGEIRLTKVFHNLERTVGCFF